MAGICLKLWGKRGKNKGEKTRKKVSEVIPALITVIALLAASVCLPSCEADLGKVDNDGNSNDQHNNTSVYSEKLVYKGGINAVRNPVPYGDKSFLALSYDDTEKISRIYKYDMNFKVTGFEYDGITEDEHSIERFGIDDSGNIYALPAIPQKDPANMYKSRQMHVYDPSGKLQRVIAIDDSSVFENNKITRIVVRNNRICLISFEGIQITDMQGKSIMEIKHPLIDADISPDNGIVLIYDDAQIKAYIEKLDGNTGASLWKNQYGSSYDRPRTVVCSLESNDFYIFLNMNLVNKHDGTGNYLETMIDLYSYGIGEKLPNNWNPCNLTKAGDFYHVSILNQALNELQIYEYRQLYGAEADRKRKEMEAKEGEAVRLGLIAFSYDNDVALKIQRYRNEHKGIMIDIMNYREDNPLSDQAVEDYRQYVNLMFMSGKEWDIISTSFMPYPAAAEDGILADLEMVKGFGAIGGGREYFSNIIDGCRYKGVLYYMPVGFSFYIVAADEQYIEHIGLAWDDANWSWEDLVSMAEGVIESGSQVKPFEYSVGVKKYSEVFAGVKGQLIDFESRKVDFHTELFDRFLSVAKEISRSDFYAVSREEKALFRIFKVSGLSVTDSVFSLYGGIKDRKVFRLPALTDKDEKIFTVTDGYAINNKSRYKEQALEFILYLADNNTMTVPVSKTAFDAAAGKFGNCGMVTPAISGDKDENAFQAAAASLKNSTTYARNVGKIDKLSEITGSLNHGILPVLGDPILQMFRMPVEKYVNGEISREQAVQELEGSVWLYLNE